MNRYLQINIIFPCLVLDSIDKVPDEQLKGHNLGMIEVIKIQQHNTGLTYLLNFK